MEEKTEKYELTLPTDKTFVKVHGNITIGVLPDDYEKIKIF